MKPMRFIPEDDEYEEGIVEGIVKGYVFGVSLDALVLLPGLLIMKYLFFWNWKRIVDPKSWGVVLAGLSAWVALAVVVVLVIVAEGI